MTLADSTTLLGKILICALAVAMLLAVLAYLVVRTRRSPERPSPRLSREVDRALTDPAYAPYGPDLSDPLAYLDDYTARALEHQRCEAYPCPHPRWRHESPTAVTVAPHCRCGELWVCRAAGPLNEPRSHSDEFRDAFYRNRNTGRW